MIVRKQGCAFPILARTEKFPGRENSAATSAESLQSVIALIHCFQVVFANSLTNFSIDLEHRARTFGTQLRLSAA